MFSFEVIKQSPDTRARAGLIQTAHGPIETPVCVCGHKARLQPLTRKAVTATENEIRTNGRSRSARLRAARVL